MTSDAISSPTKNSSMEEQNVDFGTEKPKKNSLKLLREFSD
jgi:hypothetical protein